MPPVVDKGIDRLIGALRNLASQQAKAQISERMAEAMLKQVSAQVDRSEDPFGNKWPTRIDDGAPALRGFRDAFKVQSTPRNAAIFTDKWYGIVHQKGWRIRPKNGAFLIFRLPSGKLVCTEEVLIPKRQLLPSQKQGVLGRAWTGALRQVAEGYLVEQVAKR